MFEIIAVAVAKVLAVFLCSWIFTIATHEKVNTTNETVAKCGFTAFFLTALAAFIF